MVRKVKTLLCLLGYCYTAICTAQTGFTTHVTNPEIELGKHITLVLSAPAIFNSASTDPTTSTRLDRIELSALTPLFHVDTYSETEIEAGRQTWKIRLSPYNKGKQTIPGLVFNRLKSDPIEISVTDAIDPKSNLPLTISYSVSRTMPWVREQVLVIYSLRSPLKLYDLSLTGPNIPTSVIHTLPTQEAMLQQNGNGLFQYQTGYALFNLLAGQQTIKLPPLVIKRDGTTTHHFYPPPFTLTVKPLPLYLPATVPVGKLSLETGNPFQFGLTHRLANTKFELRGQQIPSSSLPDITSQLISTDSLKTYPETREEYKISDVNGVNNTINYTLPLKPTNQGIHSLSPIRLLNFDPERGTLQASEYTLPRLVSLNIWVVAILILLFSLLSLNVIYRLYRFFRFQLRRYRYYRLALRRLATAEDQQSIRNALKLISQAEGKGQNFTPQTWLSRFASKPTMAKLHEPLNQLFYTRHIKPDQADIAALAHSLIQIIKARHSLIL